MSLRVLNTVYLGKATPGAGGGSGGGSHNLGYYVDETALTTAHPTASAGDFAIVGSTDTIWIWDTDTSAWIDSDQKGQVTSVNNQTGDVVIPALVTSADTSITQELATETIYNYGELTALTITLPATINADWACQVNFTSGTTPTALTAPNTIKWKGDDLTAGVFVPVASKRYAVLFFTDGVNVRGIVQAVA